MSKELQSRLIRFVGLCIAVKRHSCHTYEGDHLCKQLIRSSTSAALNFGEARSAESKKDFAHKQNISLKELRESYINLLIMDENQLCKNPELIERTLNEANQLVSIFVTAIKRCTQKL
jgi:four helix bundle protein